LLARRKRGVATFDEYIKKVAQCVEEIRRDGRQVRDFDCAGNPSELAEELPVRVGQQASSGIILRSDTFAELGSPDAGSCAFVLWTGKPSLIRDGRITLIGPGIQESAGASLAFAQVLMVAGEDLGDEEHSTLDQSQYVSDQIEGYMIRSTPGRMWSRISKDAAAKGFDFDVLGKALMVLFKSEMAKIQAMEVVFVTSGREDVQRLDEIAEQVRTIGKNIVRKTWLAKGYDILECTLGWDCKSCSDQAVCDEIRDVVKIRKRKIRATEKAAES
jgi:CO dehydrogenase/acetyl-CoA synthase beta subunit